MTHNNIGAFPDIAWIIQNVL